MTLLEFPPYDPWHRSFLLPLWSDWDIPWDSHCGLGGECAPITVSYGKPPQQSSPSIIASFCWYCRANFHPNRMMQNVWNGISKWMCISKPPMGLIAVLRPIMEDSGHYYSLVSHVTVEEPCTAIEFDDKTAMVYVGQQDGLVEVRRGHHLKDERTGQAEKSRAAALLLPPPSSFQLLILIWPALSSRCSRAAVLMTASRRAGLQTGLCR